MLWATHSWFNASLCLWVCHLKKSDMTPVRAAVWALPLGGALVRYKESTLTPWFNFKTTTAEHFELWRQLFLYISVLTRLSSFCVQQDMLLHRLHVCLLLLSWIGHFMDWAQSPPQVHDSARWVCSPGFMKLRANSQSEDRQRWQPIREQDSLLLWNKQPHTQFS